MAVNSRRKVRSKRKEAVYKQIIESLSNGALLEDDPVWQRAIEIGRKNHLPLTEAMRRAEQEIADK